MTDTVRLWLVERSYDDRDLIRLVYATPEGDRALRKEQAAQVMHQRGTTVTAAVDADPDALERVTDDERRAYYAEEASRMAAERDPDEPV